MTENFLHFIWNMGLFQKNDLNAVSGEKIEVIKLGIPNNDAGPDFLNAHIKINDMLWIGNVEIHINSSDWRKHNHHADSNYNNVILHVVNKFDGYEIIRGNGEVVPTVQLIYPKEYLRAYTELEISGHWVPCQGKLSSVDSITVQSWMETMLIDRIEDKTNAISQLLDETKGDWEQAFFIILCKGFGQKVNGLPFEQLGKSVPVHQIAKYRNQPLILEAFLYGQAGLLNESPKDEYQAFLQNEYQHLKKKHQLKGIDGGLWKFHRLRPLNFPTIRIAELASVLHQNTGLLNSVIPRPSLAGLYNFLSVETASYWKNHYQFGKESHTRKKILGKSTMDVIIINTIVPFLFIYGNMMGKPELKEHAMQLLTEMKPESNSIIEGWRNLGFNIKNAFDSQAYLQLKSKYCDARKCLSCRIGTYIITGKAKK